jgi:hypothetical protein
MGGVRVSLFAIALYVVAMALVACDASRSQPPMAPGALRPSEWAPAAGPSVAVPGGDALSRSARSLAASWMAPEVKREDLLYVSDVYTVTVYSYPGGKHVGTLHGFYAPLGECADRGGDVFIANGDMVWEYAHGGGRRIKTLSMPGYLAQACAVDPTTGDLAVTWYKGVSQGYVAVYQDARGTPALYRQEKMTFNFCGYDDVGNLFVDGAAPYRFAFAELPRKGDKLKTVMLDRSIGFAGPVQWDGRNVAVGDESTDTIYRFAISGSTGRLEGSTSLSGAQSLLGWSIAGRRVVGADDIPSTVRYWAYPAGGSPTKAVTKAVFHPFGVAISKGTPKS